VGTGSQPARHALTAGMAAHFPDEDEGAAASSRYNEGPELRERSGWPCSKPRR